MHGAWDENSPVALFSMSPSSQRGTALGVRPSSGHGGVGVASPPAFPLHEDSQYRRTLQFCSPQFSQTRASLTPPPLLRAEGGDVEAEGSSSHDSGLRPDWSAMKTKPISAAVALGARLDGNTLPSRLTPGKRQGARESSPCPARLPVGPPPSSGKKVQFVEDNTDELVDWGEDGDSETYEGFDPYSPRPTKLSDIPDLPPRHSDEFMGFAHMKSVMSPPHASSTGPAAVGVRPLKFSSAVEPPQPVGSGQRRRITSSWQGPATVSVDDVLERMANTKDVDRNLFEDSKPQVNDATALRLGDDDDDGVVLPQSVPRNRTAWKKRVVIAAITVSVVVSGACIGGLVAGGIIA